MTVKSKIQKPKKDVVVKKETNKQTAKSKIKDNIDTKKNKVKKTKKTSASVVSKKKKETQKFLGASKQDIIIEFAQKDGDTGSPEVQVALATYKIINLARHLDNNPKDNHSRRGLLKIISKRRRILNYLQDIDRKRYLNLIARLGLKK